MLCMTLFHSQMWHQLINQMSRDMTKTNKMSVRPAKTQISLGIRPVSSASSLCAQWVAKDPSFLHVDSEDSDQPGQMPRLIWVFVGRTVTLLVLSCRGSNVHVCNTHQFVSVFHCCLQAHSHSTVSQPEQNWSPSHLIRLRRFTSELMVRAYALKIYYYNLSIAKSFNAQEKREQKFN